MSRMPWSITPCLHGRRSAPASATACLFSDSLKPFEPVLRDGRRDAGERLRIAVELLNRERILLVLDNLESLMRPEAPGLWREREFAAFFAELVSRLTGEGRAILTCRYVPAGFDAKKQPNLAHEPMPDFTAGDFSKYLRRHEKVAQRMERGELGADLIAAFHRKLGATPRFVEQACAILGTLEADALAEQLETLAAPEPGTAGDDLWRLQQAYFRDLFLPQLHETLPPPWRLALSRLALAVEALPLDGVARVAGIDPSGAEDFARRCVGLSLLQCFGERDETELFAIYPLQREFFTAPERLAEEPRREAHLAASAFFRECFEKNREKELRMSFITGLLACLHHATAAGDLDGRIWATSKLAWPMIRHADYAEALTLVEPLLSESRHPDLLKIAARCASDTGDWPEARKLGGEEQKALQAIGDRAGEAATLAQIGMVAVSAKNLPIAARCTAIAYLLLEKIGATQKEQAFNNLIGMASDLRLDQAGFDNLLREAAEAYQRDRGAELVSRAFAGL
ncbi:MAG: hypothetical protein ACKV19_18485 [Verrucomicrobiales bacterium]